MKPKSLFVIICILIIKQSLQAQPWLSNGSSIYYNGGHVGIGTNSPTAPLHVLTGSSPLSLFECTTAGNNAITVKNTVGQLNLGIGSITPHAYVWSGTNKLFIGNDGDPIMFFDKMDAGTGRVGIGTTNPQAKLAVNGDIFSKKVKVTQTGWADHVFNSDYRLRPLSEVEQYIQQHHHLPEVPSAEEVKKDGLDLGDNQATLLKKIEELTLYVIGQNKKLEDQHKRLQEQSQKQQVLYRRVNELQDENKQLKQLLINKR